MRVIASLLSVFCILLFLWGVSKLSDKMRKIIKFSISVYFCLDLFYHYYINAPTDLHLCNTMQILLVVTIWTNWQWGYEVTLFIGVTAALIGTLFPAVTYKEGFLIFISFFLRHIFIVATPLFLTLDKKRARPHMWWKVFLQFFPFVLSVGIYDRVVNANHMWLREVPLPENFSFIALPWPGYIGQALLVLMAGSFTLFCLLRRLGANKPFSPPSIEEKGESFVFPEFNEGLKRYGRSKVFFWMWHRRSSKSSKIALLRESTKNLEKIYNTNTKHFTSSKEVDYRIPNVVHQIWLGSEVPEKYKAWMDSWKIAGWTYKLWTDKEVANFPLHNQKFYDEAENYGEKADILRYEILYREGGLYVDVDFQCLKPDLFDAFHRSFDFFMGLQPIESVLVEDRDYVAHRLGNALISSIPKHPSLQKIVLELENSYNDSQMVGIPQRTGPAYVTRKIREHQKDSLSTLRDLFLPPTFFYPLMFGVFKKKQTEKILLQLSKKPEAAAIHYWDRSWFSFRLGLEMATNEVTRRLKNKYSSLFGGKR